MALARQPPPLPLRPVKTADGEEPSVVVEDAGHGAAATPAGAAERGAGSSADAIAARAREVFERGVRCFTGGRLEEALLAFRDASVLRPQPALTVTIASCLERLGRRAEAFAEYRKYLRANGGGMGHVRRDAVEMALARLRPHVAFLDIRPPGPGISVAVDGSHVELGAEPVPVEPGAHSVEPELLEGHRVRERFIVEGGETRSVALRFPPGETAGEDHGLAVEAPAIASATAIVDERERAIDLILSTPLQDWVPKRGRWIGPAAALLAFGIGAMAGATWGLQQSPHEAGGERAVDDARDQAPRARPPAPAENIGAEPSRHDATTPALRAEPSQEPPPEPPAEPPAPRPHAGPERARSERAPPVAPASLVEVEVTSDPAGASVTAGGLSFGRTPITIFLSTGRTSVVRLELDGYVPRTVRWSPTAGRRSIHAVLSAPERGAAP